MSTSQRKLIRNDWEMSTIERKYSVPPGAAPIPATPPLQSARGGERGSTSEDLHAWSIYRQNLNSDFTDSALGSSEKSPLPYGNFQLRESTVHSIINHPRYGPKSALSSNMYTYLKFGLPRVFPPSRTRDGSSGYNSSDDGSPGPLKPRALGHGRARSELDMRSLHSSNYLRASQPRSGRISNSEANLLSVHGAHHYTQGESRSRRSVAGVERFRPSESRAPEHRRSFHDLRSGGTRESPFPRPISEQRRTSKAGSHLSVNHGKMLVPEMVRPHSVVGHTNPLIPQYYSPTNIQESVVGAFQYPHFQVRNLNIQSPSEKNRLIMQNVSFEIHGGELLAVMATQPAEGSCLLKAISGGSHSQLGKISGEFVLNGNLINRHQLKRRVAFVRHDDQWDLELTVRQTLYFQHRLRAVKRKIIKLPLNERISSLIEDLGLDQVSNTKLSGLTQSELRRLSVAVYLLLDLQIILLDQPTRGMDIFDTFFLIEYLRQWALTADMTDMSGRAVILTLQPPTYEILTMISRVLIVSNGNVMYSGATPHLLPYFASVEYPCPPFKNPSDYYLDLVTLDDLSAEAMLESSQRMQQLAELQRRRQTTLSDPGPPSHLPPTHKSASVFQQIGTLFMRNAVWSQPSSFIRYLFHILLAAIISFIVGAIFWDVPGSDPQLLLEDRLGFHYTVFCIVHWPLLILSAICYVNREKQFVLNEVRQGLYSSPIYIILKILCSLPGSLLMWLSYLIPSFIMSGLHYQGSNTESTTTFYIYISMCLIYFHALQMLTSAITWLTRRTDLSLIIVSVILFFFFFVSGHSIHVKDMPGNIGPSLRVVSPTWWLTSAVLQREMHKDAFKNLNIVCKNKQKQKSDIIVQIACPTPNGTAELEYLDFVPQRLGWMSSRVEEVFLILGIFWIVSFLLFFVLFALAVRLPTRKKKNLRTTNKP